MNPHIFLFISLVSTAVLFSGCCSSDLTDNTTFTDNPANSFYELQAKGVIDVTGSGSSIQMISITVRNTGNETLTFTIPIGAWLKTEGTYYQNMITTEAYKVSLDPQQQKVVQIPAACTNIHRAVPDSRVNFTEIVESPDRDLLTLLRYLDEAESKYEVTQAAVWIITDDAGWGQLGTLGYAADSTRRRTIDENDAAEAMRAIEKSGLNITNNAIWEDRHEILFGITDPSLKSWLEEHEATHAATVDQGTNSTKIGYAQLKPFIPWAVGVWRLESYPFGYQSASRVWTANGTYSKDGDDNARAYVRITDYGDAKSELEWRWESISSNASPSYSTKSVTAKGHLALEIYEMSTNTRGLVVRVGDRYIVTVSVENGTKADVDAIVNAIDFANLARLS